MKKGEFLNNFVLTSINTCSAELSLKKFYNLTARKPDTNSMPPMQTPELNCMSAFC